MKHFSRIRLLCCTSVFTILVNMNNTYGEEEAKTAIQDNTKKLSSPSKTEITRPTTQYSYGDWEKSIMFSEEDINNIKRVIEAYEGNNKNYLDQLLNQQNDGQVITEAIQEKIISLYPNFHLHSIAFHSKTDWSLWINDIKITNNNKKNKYELKVTSISKNGANFTWKAIDNEYMELFIKHHRKQKESKEESDVELRNRFASSKKQGYITETMHLNFYLRQNQSISSKTLRIFEGLPKTMHANSLKEPLQGTTSLVPTTNTEEKPNAEIDPQISHFNKAISDEIKNKQSPKSRMMQTLGIE